MAQGQSSTESPTTPHLSHLMGWLRHSVPVHVWSVYQEVDQRPAFGYPSQAGFWSIAEVDERGISEGWTLGFRSNGKLIQFDIHKNSLDRTQDIKAILASFCQPSWEDIGLACPRWLTVWKTGEGGLGWALGVGSWLWGAGTDSSSLWLPIAPGPLPPTRSQPTPHTALLPLPALWTLSSQLQGRGAAFSPPEAGGPDFLFGTQLAGRPRGHRMKSCSRNSRVTS